MGQGRRMRRGARNNRVDWRDVLKTLLLSDEDEVTIMAMSKAERRTAQQQARREREAPSYRDWSGESAVAYQAWERDRSPDKIWNWKLHLEVRGRPDLYRDISREDGFVCGKCGQFCEVPYAVPNVHVWLCKACTAGRPAQAGHWRQRRGI
jgi:formylmethanofuran dehydrogenase subunit E